MATAGRTIPVYMDPFGWPYGYGYGYGNYGYAAALGNVMVVLIVALLAVYLRRRLREAN